ncbi:MAG: hypothetical protein IH888_11450, partial [Planctomycetes bacterium]|nr:hypothetical protein [Planctomycetota bacterium]
MTGASIAAIGGGLTLLLTAATYAQQDFTWNGGGATDLWTNDANWLPGAPNFDLESGRLIFGSTGEEEQRPNNTAGQDWINIGGLVFNVTADAELTLTGLRSLSFDDGASITNDSTFLQTINNRIFGNGSDLTINAATGDLKFTLAINLRDADPEDAEDPGIALLEGASILGDILTFYQDLYANEAFLRTAQWRESVADLVRLLGYRLSPGLGGKATFAFEVKNDKPVVVPAGFPLQAQVEGLEQAADFETVEETIAYSALSKFHLYRPRLETQTIMAGLNNLEIDSVNGFSEGPIIDTIDIKAGDRMMLVPDAAMFDVSGTPYTAQKKAEILIVSEVQRILDRTIITFEGALTENRDTQVTAYRIGRSFRHFGHNAPAQLTKYNDSTKSVFQETTNFERNIWGTHTPSLSDV